MLYAIVLDVFKSLHNPTQNSSKVISLLNALSFFIFTFSEIKEYVYKNGKPIARLPYGFTQYSVNGISTVIDDNCMDIKRKDNLDDLKYAILRPNGHLYSAWNDTGSLIF